MKTANQRTDGRSSSCRRAKRPARRKRTNTLSSTETGDSKSGPGLVAAARRDSGAQAARLAKSAPGSGGPPGQHRGVPVAQRLARPPAPGRRQAGAAGDSATQAPNPHVTATVTVPVTEPASGHCGPDSDGPAETRTMPVMTRARQRSAGGGPAGRVSEFLVVLYFYIYENAHMASIFLLDFSLFHSHRTFYS